MLHTDIDLTTQQLLISIFAFTMIGPVSEQVVLVVSVSTL